MMAISRYAYFPKQVELTVFLRGIRRASGPGRVRSCISWCWVLLLNNYTARARRSQGPWPAKLAPFFAGRSQSDHLDTPKKAVKTHGFCTFSLSWVSHGPRWSKMAPRCPKIAPRWPEIAPRWPHGGPNRAQDGPKMAPRLLSQARRNA